MNIKAIVIEALILIPVFMIMRCVAFKIDERKGAQIDRFGFICYLLGMFLEMLFCIIREGVK